MNDQLQNALVNIIEQSSNGINKSVSFLSDQLPDVINQLLIWKALESFLLFSIGVFIIWIGCVFAKKQKPKVEKAKEDYKNGEPWTRYYDNGNLTSSIYDIIVISPYIYFVGSVILGLTFILVNHKWIMILVAPKIYLIEYAASLVN